MDQYYFTVDAEKKFELLLRLLKREQPKQAIIFCRTKRGTDKVTQRLLKKIPTVACIHGDLSQGGARSRDEILRSGMLRILVATDVVGRGIDVSGLSHIINYDIRSFAMTMCIVWDSTGRMGKEGTAFTSSAPKKGAN